MRRPLLRPLKVLAKVTNIACQTLLFVSVQLIVDDGVMGPSKMKNMSAWQC